ncbi:MAG: hypothetical protein ABIE74_06910 [Pseudomonadota bacterium]
MKQAISRLAQTDTSNIMRVMQTIGVEPSVSTPRALHTFLQEGDGLFRTLDSFSQRAETDLGIIGGHVGGDRASDCRLLGHLLTRSVDIELTPELRDVAVNLNNASEVRQEESDSVLVASLADLVSADIVNNGVDVYQYEGKEGVGPLENLDQLRWSVVDGERQLEKFAVLRILSDQSTRIHISYRWSLPLIVVEHMNLLCEGIIEKRIEVLGAGWIRAEGESVTLDGNSRGIPTTQDDAKVDDFGLRCIRLLKASDAGLRSIMGRLAFSFPSNNIVI